VKVLKACRIVENKEYKNLENIAYFKDTELEENTNIVKNPHLILRDADLLNSTEDSGKLMKEDLKRIT
jgi:hypothetical protein